MQYTQDYDEKLPKRCLTDPTGQNTYEAFSWRRQIYPYVKSTQLFACPSNTNNATFAYDSDPGSMTNNGLNPNTDVRFPVSYSINGWDITDTSNPPNYLLPCTSKVANSLATFDETATTILVGEYEDWYSELNLDTWPKYFKGHLGTSNFLFADGHVKALKPIATIGSTNMWTLHKVPAGTTDLAYNRIHPGIPVWQTKENAG